MIDPITISLAVGVASKAFSAIKQGFARYELKMFLNLTYGPQAYDELLQMEGQIRKDRQKQVYAQQKLRQQIGDGIAIFVLVLLLFGGLGLLGWLWLANE